MILKYIHSIYDTKHTSNPICLLSYFKIFRGGGGGVNGRKIIMFSVLKTNTCIHYFD